MSTNETEERTASDKKSIYDVLGRGTDTSQYLSDDTDYINYDEYEEAELVLIPIEEDEEEQAVPKERPKLYSFNFSFDNIGSVLSSIGILLTLLGEKSTRVIVTLFAVAVTAIKIPFILLWQKILYKIVLFVTGKVTIKAKKWKLKDFKLFHDDVKKAVKKAKEKKQDGYKPSFKAFLENLRLSFSKHRRVWLAVLNTVFPVACLAVLILTVNGFANASFALQVNYNGENIGYIKDQNVFTDAKESAVKRLSVTSDNVTISQPTYKVALMTPDKLSDADTICDRIIEHTDGSYINACGIYIDGEFICAVTSEADAISVFDSILEPYKESADKNSSVAFVQEITYVQGYYNDNESVIWDTEKLREEMTSQKSKAVYYTVEDDDTLTSIARKNNLYLSELIKLNSTVKEESLHVGDKILVSAQVNYIRVKVMKTESYKKYIPYETETRDSSSLYKGTSKTVQKGVYGKEKITEIVTYIDGIKTYSSPVSTKTIREPVNKIVEQGTKEVVVSQPTHSYTTGYSSYTTGYSSYTTDYSSYKQGDGNTSYTGGAFGSPLATSYWISSGYGYRDASISGWAFHGGTDFVPSGGSSNAGVLAVQAGTVTSVQQSYSGYGYSVLITHGNGLQTRYAHMRAGSINVSVGQSVSKGQQIGIAGSTGNSTGIHLHFEVIKNGTRVNPMSYF